jgi:hypothetical protein
MHSVLWISNNSSREGIDKVYDLIAECLRTYEKNKQACWIMYQISDPESSLFLWSKDDIKDGLKNLRDVAVTTTTEKGYPLFLTDNSDW